MTSLSDLQTFFNLGHPWEQGSTENPQQARRKVLRTPDPEWLLIEEDVTPAREHEIESLFAIANGYAGLRASLAEGCELAAPATFVAGIFEYPVTPGSVPQLMIFPDWSSVRIWVDGQPLTMHKGHVLEHRRVLDLRQGMLWREWRHHEPSGRITRLLTLRLASSADRHLFLQWILLTAENYSATLHFESSIGLGAGTEPRLPRNWKTRRGPDRPNLLPVTFDVPGREEKVQFTAASQLQTGEAGDGKREIKIDNGCVAERLCTHIGVGGQCQLHRAVSVYTSRDGAKPFRAALTRAKTVLASGLQVAALAHASEWRARWQAADVQIEGDDHLQQALRFAAYHLISATNPEDSRVSIGARALTGKAYKGHVFWDTEIYMLPFYIATHPESARALLGYRYYTLPAAREKARSAGFRGAMYPWESADTGEETTPTAVITPAGDVLKIRNGEMEIHITADIAYAVWHYWKATEDDAFFLDRGAEIMLETARFWASRGTLESDGVSHIRHVIGPDEYHEDVDDNAYTNLLATWNLRRGADTASLLKERWVDRWRELAARLQLTDEELALWPKLADVMATGFDPRTLLFEQFVGYFKKEQIDLKKYEPRSAAMDVILGHNRMQQTNIVKQPDVLMAIYLLWEDFPADVRRANFRYYEPRTAHGSSLSPSIHALIAARLDDTAVAQHYLKQSAEIDLGNTMGNAAAGVHVGANAGLWQAAVFGLAGLQTCSDGLRFAPHLLPHWRRLSFPVQWRNRSLQISVEPDSVRVAVQGANPLKLFLNDGPGTIAIPNHEYLAERRQSGWSPWRALGEL